MDRDTSRSLFVLLFAFCVLLFAFCFLLFACLSIGASPEAVNREISIEGEVAG